MTTLSEAIEQVKSGSDPATVLADLQSTPLHKRDAMVTSSDPTETDLLEMLVETKMLWLSPSSAGWEGPLVTYAEDPATDPALRTGLGVLLAYLQTSNRPLPVATKEEFAILFNQMCQVMLGLGVPQATIDAYVATMTGGRLYADLTVEKLNKEVAESNSLALHAHYSELFNTHIAPVLQDSDPAVVTDASFKTALMAIHDNWTDQI